MVGLTPSTAAAGAGPNWPALRSSTAASAAGPAEEDPTTTRPAEATTAPAQPATAPPGSEAETFAAEIAAGVAAATGQAAAQPAEPTGELVDVFTGLGADDSDQDPVGGDPGSGTSTGVPGVDPQVQAEVDGGGNVSVIIRLRDQADLDSVQAQAAVAGRAAAAATGRELQGEGSPAQLSQAADDAARAARGTVVVDALQRTADTTQDGVRELLDAAEDAGQVDDVQEFWIFSGFSATVDAAGLDALAAHPDVASVTLNDTIELEEPILAETGAPLLPSWSLERVNAPDVWGEYGVRGAGVVVGVMDSGVDGTHPALAESWRGNDGDTDKSWFAATGENYPLPGDGFGHGTHVTGSILGAPPGEVTGVAPDAEWIAAKIFTDFGGTSDAIIHAGFEWLLAPGGDPAAAPDVVNNSWGSDATFDVEFFDDVAAWVAAGIVPIFSNGNNGPGIGTVGSPASFPHAIGVGATDIEDRIAFFSSRGPVVWDGVEHTKPQISAPGYQIRSSWPADLPDGPFHTISGTSMAAPHVTGVVALMLSAAPDLTVDEVREALETTARHEPHMVDPNLYGAGVVDAFAAVTHIAHSGTVTGAVTDPAGLPVEATVQIAGRTTTSAGGGYSVRVPEGTHELVVSGYGYAPQTHQLTVSVGATVTVDVTLEVAPEQTLSGTVTGPDGPVSGARVAVVDTPVEAVRTGSDGGFTLTVAEGSYDLRVTASGHQPAVIPVVVDGPTGLTVDLGPVAGPVAGWAQYQNNPARTGQGAEALAAETLEPAWTADVGSDVLFSSPVIGDGRVFVNSTAGLLSAFDLDDGEPLWVFEGSEDMRGVPAVSGGIVYTGGGVDGGFHAVDAATGELVWRVPTPGRRTIYAAPVVAGGVVYATTGFTTDRPDTVFALDAATGAELWSTDIGSSVFFGPAVADGIVVAASADDRRLVGLDATTGAELWSLERDIDEFIAGPSIADGTVYVTTTVPSTGGFAPQWQGSLLAVDAATGQLRWEVPAHGDGQGSSPAVHGDLVIAGSRMLGFVAAYDRETGEPVWHYGVEDSGGVSAGMLVSGDGYVFGGSQIDQRLWALDAGTGELVWEHPLDENVTSSAAYAEGRLVITDLDGNLHAFHPSGQVAGVVTGPDGPLPATVRVVGTGIEVQADGQTGAYTISGLVPGGHTIEVSHYGFATQTRTVDVAVAQTTTVDLELAPVGDGSVTGVVRDGTGQGLAGAAVTLTGTPLDPVVSGEDGGYGFGQVAAGTYEIVVDAGGFTQGTQTITVTAGEAAVVDFTLERFEVAVVADREGAITAELAARGWQVERVSWAEIAGTVGNYGVVVLSGMTGDEADDDLERFAQIVADADAAGTSLVVLDQWLAAYGSIGALSTVTGDPAGWHENSSFRGTVWLEDIVEHPITASLPDLERVPLLTLNARHAWFTDYSGYTLASLGTDGDGVLGGGIGYQRRTLDSNHVLLPVHAPTPFVNPEEFWEPAMSDLLAGAVQHAADASYGAVAGQVTGADGSPLAATVEVVGSFEHTAAASDGAYRLLLEPGDYTLRFRFVGAETVELPVSVVEGQTLDLNVQLPSSGIGSIAGLVTDAGSQAPIAGATVTLRDTGLPAATTGADGRYAGTVPGGSYQVEVAAEGYGAQVLEGVVVTDGVVTTLDVALDLAPRVVVVGDRNSELTDLLLANAIPAREAGWEVIEQLADVDVVVLQHPPSLDKDEFLAALAAFDEAGVSVVFPSDPSDFRTRGIDQLIRHTGDPADLGDLGGFRGPSIFLHNLADHPLFAGVEGDPVRLLNPGADAASFIDYSGVTLADIADEGTEPVDAGIAYNPRTPESVHLLLGGLTATISNSPAGNWTDEARRIFLNAMRWAAAPGLGGLTGTVTDPAGEPIPGAVVEVGGTPWSAVTDQDGGFEIGVPPGTYTLTYRAFGYLGTERAVTVGADQRIDVSAQLEVAPDVGTITGVVTSVDGAGGAAALPGVRVSLRGTPLTTTTGPDGSYTLTRVEPGSRDLELEVDGHARTLSAVEVPPAATVQNDVALRVSPVVGIIDDSDFTNSRDRGKDFLEDWGYQAEDIGFDSLDRIAELDLIIANVSDFDLDPGAEGLAAFEEAVNRARVPVLWMGQQNRGAIQFLNAYHGDPAVVGDGSLDGTVTATVVQDHPLVAGLPDQFEPIAPDAAYSFFDEFRGTTVATLSTGDGGQVGGTIAYRGRTADTVDVLLSTLSISTLGAPSTRLLPAVRWTPEAERVYVNALQWALEAQGLGAEVSGTVHSDRFGLIPSQVTVLETGRTYQGRAGDGTFLVPLQPGTWTLEVSSFGHAPATVPVTVQAGQRLAQPVTLVANPSGTLTGTVTGPDGAGVPGAQLTLRDTPLGAATGADGGYTIADVPEGQWTLRIDADGFRSAEVPVTVVAGQATQADVQLKASAQVAIVDTTGSSTDGTELADLIRDEGYQVDMFARSAAGMTALSGRVEEFDLIVFNVEPLSSGRTQYRAVMDAAIATGVSTIFGSQFGGNAMRELSEYRGDPAEVDWDFVHTGIDYVPRTEHPIFAGFPVGEPIELITSNLSNLNQQYGVYAGWSGETIADLRARLDGDDHGAELGEAVGYRFTSPTSVELLLGSLTSTSHGSPGERWTGNARQIYVNAVGWAIDAQQAELVGVVTGGGEPVAGATVTAVEAGKTTVTGPDGSFALGLAGGTYTLRVSAFGFVTAEQSVQVPDTGTVTLDVDLIPLPRGSVSGTVRSSGGNPVAGATLTGTGIEDWTATTGEDGTYTAGDLLEGDYQVTIAADGFLPATATVTIAAAAPATLDVSLRPTDVGVLGDVDGSLTGYLQDAEVPAAELEWASDLDLTGYDVVVVNGGSPDAETFTAVLAAADEAQVSLVFSGTWAVDRGGIRLLERYTDRVVVGTQGYGDGPVQLAGFDPAHPLSVGLPDPATLIVDGGYYSVIEEYVGEPLADLHVTRDGSEPVTGMAAGWAWRTADSVEILLSASAVTEAVGPGLGWTPEGGQLVENAIAWARDPALAPPAAPTLEADAPAVVTGSVTVRGEAEWPFPVTVVRDGEPVVTVDPELDGTWSAEVPLEVGDNELTAVASNARGDSPASAPVTVASWVPEWSVVGVGPVRTVILELEGAHPWPPAADKAELVVRNADGDEVAREEMLWIAIGYLHVLSGLDRGEYTLSAELTVDGHLVVVEGPGIRR